MSRATGEKMHSLSQLSECEVVSPVCDWEHIRTAGERDMSAISCQVGFGCMCPKVYVLVISAMYDRGKSAMCSSIESRN